MRDQQSPRGLAHPSELTAMCVPQKPVNDAPLIARMGQTLQRLEKCRAVAGSIDDATCNRDLPRPGIGGEDTRPDSENTHDLMNRIEQCVSDTERYLSQIERSVCGRDLGASRG